MMRMLLNFLYPHQSLSHEGDYSAQKIFVQPRLKKFRYRHAEIGHRGDILSFGEAW
jgi:hypothetical protein